MTGVGRKAPLAMVRAPEARRERVTITPGPGQGGVGVQVRF